jgi:polyferredoxin
LLIPFIKYQAITLLFNVIERKFILLGLAFGPHDFYLLVLGIIAFVIFIFLFTAVFGRVFCGWACPQTVFLELVFRKIEYLIEGDFLSQKRLSKAPWGTAKTIRKLAKWLILHISQC